MILCDCGWKYCEDRAKCPACGKDKPQDNRITQWNSTIKVNPNNSLKRSAPKRKKSGDSELKKAMEDKARQHLKETNGEPVCENCGMRLPKLRYSNVSHKKKRSTHPKLRTAIENLEILCSGENFWGGKDESCHTAWERNNFEKFRELKGSREGETGT